MKAPPHQLFLDIRTLVDGFPPLTGGQRTRLAAILRIGTVSGPEDADPSGTATDPPGPAPVASPRGYPGSEARGPVGAEPAST